MKFDWNNWNVGGKTIFVAACVAVLSMFLKWVDLRIVSANGFSQGTFLFLGVFVYPVLMLLQQRPINRNIGVGCAVGGIVLALGYYLSSFEEIMGRTVVVAGSGPWVFLFASIALLVGVLKYEPVATAPAASEESKQEPASEN